MKISASVGAILALQATSTSAKVHSHNNLAVIERRHRHEHAVRHAQPSPAEISNLEERQNVQCAWPSNKGLIRVAGAQNAGWAMSPDQPCEPGNWCQYACPPGTLMTSWNPAFSSYPSKDGGVFCDLTGKIILPPGPLCKQGATNIKAVDATGKGVSFCQTVAPGNEAQLIPTWIAPNSEATLAIPQPDFFGKIPAHYYINEPGFAPDKTCLWGSDTVSLGNWATFVGGGLQTSDGKTWIDLGLNPKYVNNFSNKPIDFKVEIVCDGECNGHCEYDPSKHGLLEMVGKDWTMSGDGAPFCTTCVTSGSAYYKVSMLDGSDAPSGPSPGKNDPSSSSAETSSISSSGPSSSSSSSSNADDSSSSTIESDVSSTSTATGTTWSAHILLQGAGSSTSVGADSASTPVGQASVLAATTTGTAPSASSSGAATHFAAPATGLALTGLTALFFL